MPATNYRANGTIQPCSFVKLDSTAGKSFNVIACAAATDRPVGIAQEGSYDPPGLTGSATDAARAGLPLRVYQDGDECLLVAGSGGFTQGDYLVSDASGNGVTEAFGGAFTVPPRWVGAQAQENAAAGERGRVRVRIFASPTAT